MADISNLCQFGWHEWVYYQDNNQSFPHDKERLGEYLRLAKRVGNEMCQ